MAQVSRRHHTLPRFYLQGFARDGQITTVQLPGDRRFVQSINDASVQTDFYSIPDHPDGTDIFEKYLSSVEGRVKHILDRDLRHKRLPSSEDRAMLAMFVVLQALRGPDQRRNMEVIAAEMARQEIGHGGRENLRRWVHANIHNEVTEERLQEIWEEATQLDGPSIKVAPVAHIQMIIRLVPEIYSYVIMRPMSVVYFERRSLITCDAPVSLVAKKGGYGSPSEGIGFASAWGVALPLARKIGLMFHDPFSLPGAPTFDEVASGTRDAAVRGSTVYEKLFNTHTVAGARRWIFHHPDDTVYVPDNLSQPRPSSMQVAGVPDEFSGQPWQLSQRF